MKTARAVMRAGEGQSDCYWHDNSMSMRYLIVLQGVASPNLPDPSEMMLALREGRVNYPSSEFTAIALREPDNLPGPTGPLTVLLIV